MEKLVIEHFKKAKKDYVWNRQLKPLPSTKKGGALLEVGCGTRFYYSPSGFQSYGLDLVKDMIVTFKNIFPNSSALVADVKNIPFRSHSFDVVAANMLLHHLVGKSISTSQKNIQVATGEMVRVLKKDGVLLINEHLPKNKLLKYFMFFLTLICAKLDIELRSLDIHSKVVTYFLTKKEFLALFSRHKFKTTELSSREWKVAKINIGRSNVEFILKHVECTPQRLV